MFPHGQCVVVGQWHLIIWSSPNTCVVCASDVEHRALPRYGVCGWVVCAFCCRTAPCWHGVEQHTQLSHVLWHAVRVFGSSFKEQFFWFSVFFCA